MDDQLGAVALDHAAGPLLAEHVHQVRAHLQRGDGREVRRARVEHAAPEHGDTPALALVHRARQLRHDGLHLLQHLRLLGADGGPLLAPANTQSSAENVPSLHNLSPAVLDGPLRAVRGGGRGHAGAAAAALHRDLARLQLGVRGLGAGHPRRAGQQAAVGVEQGRHLRGDTSLLSHNQADASLAIVNLLCMDDEHNFQQESKYSLCTLTVTASGTGRMNNSVFFSIDFSFNWLTDHLSNLFCVNIWPTSKVSLEYIFGSGMRTVRVSVADDE